MKRGLQIEKHLYYLVLVTFTLMSDIVEMKHTIMLPLHSLKSEFVFSDFSGQLIFISFFKVKKQTNKKKTYLKITHFNKTSRIFKLHHVEIQ